jgi:PilZ domain
MSWLRRERRQSRREGLNLPVQFRIYIPSCPEICSCFLPAQLHDISQQGISLDTDAIHSDAFHIFQPTVTTFEQCLIEIRISNGGDSLSLHGRAVWYDRNVEDHPFAFRVGIQILGQIKDLRKQIEASLREQGSATDPSSPSPQP